MAGESILVVDDHPQNLKLARVILEFAGYTVRTAATATEALFSVAESPPELILMDLQLPGMDGLELTRRLKADERYRDIIVVALTAYAMHGDRERAIAAGCDAYVAKPLDTQTFPRLIADLLERGSGPDAS